MSAQPLESQISFLANSHLDASEKPADALAGLADAYEALAELSSGPVRVLLDQVNASFRQVLDGLDASGMVS